MTDGPSEGRRAGPPGVSIWELELLMGLEPMTSSLPRKCSTTELQQHPFPAPSGASRTGWGVIDPVYTAVPTGRARSTREDPDGAGGGNRTLVCSLEGCRSTIELHPLRVHHMHQTADCSHLYIYRVRRSGPALEWRFAKVAPQ